MTLKAGYPRRRADSQIVIDDAALVDTMAGYIDEAMRDVYKTMKNKDLPDAGEDDRRILFVAIARGVLKYLNHHENEFISTMRFDGSATTQGVSTLNLDITIESTTV